MFLELYAVYLVACFIIVIVPGPTVTPVVANSLRYGAHAGLLSVFGTQLGLEVIVAVVGIGLTSAIEALGHWFDVLRLIGAAYLVWLGWRMIRERGGFDAARRARPPRGGVREARGPAVAGCRNRHGSPSARRIHSEIRKHALRVGRNLWTGVATTAQRPVAAGAIWWG